MIWMQNPETKNADQVSQAQNLCSWVCHVWAFISPPQSPRHKLNHIGCLRLQHSQSDRPTDFHRRLRGVIGLITFIYLSPCTTGMFLRVLPLSPKSSSNNVSAHAQLDLLRINMNAKSSMKSEPNGARPNISSKSYGPDDAPVRKWKRKTIFDNSRKPPFALKLCARDEILERLFSEKKGSGGEGS
jgi:hypothetical protein